MVNDPISQTLITLILLAPVENVGNQQKLKKPRYHRSQYSRKLPKQKRQRNRKYSIHQP